MDERQQILQWMGDNDVVLPTGAFNALVSLLQAGRRTTPDRDCEWRLDDADNGIWESACGETWLFVDGGPIENRMLFCHRCGGILKITPTDASEEGNG